MEIKNLLDLRSVGISEIEQRFEEIAKQLFQKYHIKKGNDTYDFLEIEFYYYTKGHEDIITYPRNINSGKWFFHASGVDISFESNCEDSKLSLGTDRPENIYFGGILIRSLLKNGTEHITGPQKCTWILFDYLDAFKAIEKELPIITERDKNEDVIVLKAKRYIPISQDKAQQRFMDNYPLFDEYKEKLYRFYIKHPKWDEIKKSDYSARPW